MQRLLGDDMVHREEMYAIGKWLDAVEPTMSSIAGLAIPKLESWVLEHYTTNEERNPEKYPTEPLSSGRVDAESFPMTLVHWEKY